MGEGILMMHQNIRSIKKILPRMMRHAPLSLPQKVRRLRQKISAPLYKSIPLAVPLSLHIDPCNICNFKCAFCPTSDNALLASMNRFKGVMPLELFCTIIDDIEKEVRSNNVMLQQLHLYKDGEPLLNNRFIEMAAYAK
jgi:sulfatase maturation enzyme AslB (radical SAM superfamily)